MGRNEGETVSKKVTCRKCRFAKKAYHFSYYGGNGYRCTFGVIPDTFVLDENGTCKNGELNIE